MRFKEKVSKRADTCEAAGRAEGKCIHMHHRGKSATERALHCPHQAGGQSPRRPRPRPSHPADRSRSKFLGVSQSVDIALTCQGRWSSCWWLRATSVTPPPSPTHTHTHMHAVCIPGLAPASSNTVHRTPARRPPSFALHGAKQLIYGALKRTQLTWGMENSPVRNAACACTHTHHHPATV